MTRLKLGVIVSLERGPEEEIRKVRSLDLPTCQISCWNQELLNSDNAEKLKAASREYDVEITTIWTGLPGKAVWNFIEGPITIGLVPAEMREVRIKALKKGSDFARLVGVESITTHVGFIPEWPGDRSYKDLVAALKQVSSFCKSNDQSFWFETGQETPITLLRTIEDVGTDNLGINLDPANLLMYGKANPIDALDIFGRYVRGVHAKDGDYPTNGRELGKELPLGEGRVNFPVLIPKLKSMGYRGALTIEREISGPQQIEDIKRAKKLLEPLC
ncbi:MAG: sugar phosphate isomerase/epimerase family protein [Thermoproteota archaeon]